MSATVSKSSKQSAQLFGHPTGLFALFFAEMWERFSYYGMRALLIFYMIKGFLGYGDNKAYGVYGAYTALVYMTPYFGGMLADRLLGQRRAVILGGCLMAAGHLLMTVQTPTAFFAALALLICGNGFFKPNISTVVGSLYDKGSGRKDGGFTIFYMGINLGAAMAPILCGYVGQTYGWHYGFGLATIGMLVGVSVFAAPTRLTQALILGTALITAISMPLLQDSLLQLAVRLLLSVALLSAGVIAVVALGRGGLPEGAGAPPDPAALRRKLGGVLRADVAVLLGSLAAVVFLTFVVQQKSIAAWTLNITGGVAFLYLFYEAIFRSNMIERHRLFVVITLSFFSMLFWAFFEQAGSSISNFTDRNVNRVFASKQVSADEIGKEIRFRIPSKPDDAEVAALPLLSQAQLGQRITAKEKEDVERALRKHESERGTLSQKDLNALADKVRSYDVLTPTGLDVLRSVASSTQASKGDMVFAWTVLPENVGMEIGNAEIPASEFQAANPVFILTFGLVFSFVWTFLGARGIEPSTPFKFALGLLQLGLGFGVLWYAVQRADPRGMTAMPFLLLAYLLHTTGELCLSPVGLSMVTKLSPQRMVSTVMGIWFLATSFSNLLAGMIATFTGVSGDEDAVQVIPPPTQTLGLYGDVFGKIALVGIGCSALCFILVPFLKRGMHEEENTTPESAPAEGAAA